MTCPSGVGLPVEGEIAHLPTAGVGITIYIRARRLLLLQCCSSCCRVKYSSTVNSLMLFCDIFEEEEPVNLFEEYEESSPIQQSGSRLRQRTRSRSPVEKMQRGNYSSARDSNDPRRVWYDNDEQGSSDSDGDDGSWRGSNCGSVCGSTGGSSISQLGQAFEHVRFSESDLGRCGYEKSNPQNISQGRRAGHEESFVRPQEKSVYVSNDNEGSLEEDRIKQEVRNIFTDSFRKAVPRRKILHDIYERVPDDSRIRDFYRSLGKDYTGAVLIVFAHGDHWHVIHDCSYSSSTCRCARIIEINSIYRRYSRRSISRGGFDTIHWVNLAMYTEKGKKYIYLKKIKINN